MRSLASIAAAAAAAAAVAAASSLSGCGGAEPASSPAPSVSAAVSLARSGVAPAFGAAHPFFEILASRVPLSSIDSLLVTATRVDVLPDSVLAACRPPMGDSVRGFHPGAPGGAGMGGGMSGPRGPFACQGWQGGGHGMMGPGFGRPGGMPDSVIPFPRPDDPRTRGDSLLPPGRGWGSRLEHWYSLTVVASGRLDLMHLPTDTANGLVLAADSVPAGNYGAARLIVSAASIWFNTAITTDDSVTLQPNTAYPVELPHRPGGAMGIMTTAGFTVPSGGGNVVLVFDVGQMLAAPIVTDSGKVVLGPMLRPRRK